MNVEIVYIAIMLLSGGLWALGGTQISDKIGGQKWLRRFALPITLALIVGMAFDIALWRCIAFAVLSMATFSMGYGDRSDWWKFNGSRPPKWFVAVCIYAPSAFIGFSWWLIISPIVFLTLFWLSKKDQRSFRWKIVEFIHGLMVGLCIVGAL